MKGLKGDGHGGWYDQKGNFVAKTVNGKLQFTGGRKAAKPKILNLLRLQLQKNQKQNQRHLLQAASCTKPKAKPETCPF